MGRMDACRVGEGLIASLQLIQSTRSLMHVFANEDLDTTQNIN